MRKPNWLKTRLPGKGYFPEISRLLKELGLNTICNEAHCPNLGRCWARGTATIMILGDVCTRSCKFCSVQTGEPGPVDEREPIKVAYAAEKLGIKYLVVTSVDRDDLQDCGAKQFARTIVEVKKRGIEVEVLVPDFGGNAELIKDVIDEKPSVFGHNLETVRKLTPDVRDERSTYELSMAVLRAAKKIDENQITKSGIMVGLGETDDEVIDTLNDIRDAGVSIFTIGQYLQPTTNHLPVKTFIEPSRFNFYRQEGEKRGLRVVSGPLVRSSYMAETVYRELRRKDGDSTI